jgi:hypothetical protein
MTGFLRGPPASPIERSADVDAFFPEGAAPFECAAVSWAYGSHFLEIVSHSKVLSNPATSPHRGITKQRNFRWPSEADVGVLVVC